ncbi:hypothetical protein [Enterococcus sp. AZ192]|uniref:hypothetical protein n=1 Tax=unclassified Enterococcus TaxID=2608891 RepID=UPI003D2681D9
MKISIQGTVFNISFDNKKIVRGWWLLVDNDGEEYLVRQNFFLFGFKLFKFNRNIYKASKSLKKYSVSSEEIIKQTHKKTGTSYLGIGLAIPIGAILRGVIPLNWLWGESNLPINYITGITNLIFFWILLILSLKVIFYYRKKKFEKEIQNLEIELVEIGKGYADSPLQITQNILKWW